MLEKRRVIVVERQLEAEPLQAALAARAQTRRFEAALAIADEIGLTEDRVVNRNAESVLAHLTAKRERLRLDAGGEWKWPAPPGSDAGEERPW